MSLKARKAHNVCGEGTNLKGEEMRKERFVCMGVFLPSTVVLAILPVCASFGVTGAELTNLLREKDGMTDASAYEISFAMTTQSTMFDPNQGLVFADCIARWMSDGTFVMKTTYCYEHPPVFARAGTRRYTPSDFDKSGNLLVSRPLEKYIFFSRDRSETVETSRSYFVDPNSALVDKGGAQVIMRRFPPGDRTYTYELNQFQLATGRGLSRHLGAIRSIESISSGMKRVVSEGSFGEGIPRGSWRLIIDPNSGYIVRNAVFTPADHESPLVEVATEGTIAQDEISLARYGTFKYANLLEVVVGVGSVSRVSGPNEVYREVLSKLNSPLPLGSEIMDLRGEEINRTTVRQ